MLCSEQPTSAGDNSPSRVSLEFEVLGQHAIIGSIGGAVHGSAPCASRGLARMVRVLAWVGDSCGCGCEGGRTFITEINVGSGGEDQDSAVCRESEIQSDIDSAVRLFGLLCVKKCWKKYCARSQVAVNLKYGKGLYIIEGGHLATHESYKRPADGFFLLVTWHCAGHCGGGGGGNMKTRLFFKPLK